MLYLIALVRLCFDGNWASFTLPSFATCSSYSWMIMIIDFISSCFLFKFDLKSSFGCVINHREKIFFRYYLSSAVCVCVCMYVFAITATPFNLELSNLAITFLMWISKNDFLKFLKNCFLQSYCPFLYFFKISL